MRLRVLIGCVLVLAPSLSAQSTSDRTLPKFGVASIKRASPPPNALPYLLSMVETCGLPGVDRAGSRVAIPTATLCGLIRIAYNVADYQVSGVPPALAKGDASNLLEVVVPIEAGVEPTMDDTRLMLQTLLAERFRLRLHREPRELPVYALTIVAGGPKWAPCTNPAAPSTYTPGRLLSCTPPLGLARVAQMLTREAGRPVLDKTGVTGAHTFELRWLPDGAPALPDSPPSLITAIQEQLGLKLEPQRGPVDSIVVDHAEAPTPN